MLVRTTIPASVENAFCVGCRQLLTSHPNAKKAGVYKLTCKVTKSTRKARGSGHVRVRLVTSFTPTGGTATSTTKTVTLLSLKPRYTG